MKISESLKHRVIHATAADLEAAITDGQLDIDQPIALDGVDLDHDGLDIRTTDGGYITMPDQSSAKHALRINGNGCTVNVVGERPTSGALIVNNGLHNTVSVVGSGKTGNAHALVSEGYKADHAVYPWLDLRDCTKAWRKTGPATRISFGEVKATSAVFLIDSDGPRVQHTSVERLTIRGSQDEQWDNGKESVNGHKLAYVDLATYGLIDCAMPDRSRHFCMSTQQEVGVVRIDTLKTNQPFRVIGKSVDGHPTLRELHVGQVIAPTLGDKWLQGAERVGAVYVRGKPWRPSE